MQLNFAGQSGQYWFIGVVEDNLDPENSGRVRVRCFGIHTDNKSAIPTNSLPWALVGVSTNSSSSDIATIVVGTVVYGVFLDGQDMQLPMVQFVIPGLHVDTNTALGFSNLKNPAPKRGSYTGNPYARVKNIPTRAYYTDQQSAKSITISEPKNTRNPKYTYNIATMSDSGHVIEQDDTPGAERVCVQHRNGAYLEFNQHGDGVMKVVKDLYHFCVNHYEAINASRAISVGKGDYLKVISGDKVIEIPGGKYILEASGADISIKGDYKLAVTGDCTMTINGNLTENVNGNYNIKVGGMYSVSASTASVIADSTLILDGGLVMIG